MVSEVWETSHLFIFAVFIEQIAGRILTDITYHKSSLSHRDCSLNVL